MGVRKSGAKGGVRREAAADADGVPDPPLAPLLEVAADYYWEQDTGHRFTVWRPTKTCADPAAAADGALWLGKTSAELCAPPGDDRDHWVRHRAQLDAHEPFRDVLHTVVKAIGTQHVSLSGAPAFDSQGAFLGYRGIARDVGALVRLEDLLELEGDVARAFAAADTIAGSLPLVLQRACAIGQYDGGRYFSVAERTRTLRQIASYGATGAAALVDGATAPEWLAADPVCIADLALDERTETVGSGWISGLIVPVVTGATLVGVLDFYSRRALSPDQGFVRVLRGVAVQLAHWQARSAAIEQLRDSEARFASTMALAAIGISHVDDGGRFLYANPQLCAMLGYTERELLGLTVKDLTHPDDTGVTAEPLRQLHEGGIQSFKAEKRYLRKDGSTMWVGLTVALKRDRDGAHAYDVSIVEDISARKEAERRVQYLASHDALTDLPNRATFAQLLAQSSESARRRGTRLAVLFVDLDRFKVVNDTLGHEAGDLLLQATAARLRASVRATDVVARLGGDEFVVMLQDVPNQTVAAKVAGGILTALRPPVLVRGKECAVSASIGICLHPDGAQEDHAVLRNADMAMYLAKQSGKNGYRFFVDELGTIAAERAALETRLRGAWERGEYELRYDATVDSAGAVVGLSARVHWTSKELEGVPTERVASVAREAGLVMRINQWALSTACAASVAWQRAGRPPVRVSVPVGRAQLRDPAFVASVREVLEREGLEPRWLELDITEEALLGDPERVILALEALTALGVKVAIDAYGTGRSSFADLRRYPIATLKLHATRVDGVTVDADKRRYVEGLLALATALRLAVVATGVAKEADAAFLHRCGCSAWQGPLGPAALAAGECEKLLAARASPP